MLPSPPPPGRRSLPPRGAGAGCARAAAPCGQSRRTAQSSTGEAGCRAGVRQQPRPGQRWPTGARLAPPPHSPSSHTHHQLQGSRAGHPCLRSGARRAARRRAVPSGCAAPCAARCRSPPPKGGSRAGTHANVAVAGPDHVVKVGLHEPRGRRRAVALHLCRRVPAASSGPWARCSTHGINATDPVQGVRCSKGQRQPAHQSSLTVDLQAWDGSTPPRLC